MQLLSFRRGNSADVGGQFCSGLGSFSPLLLALFSFSFSRLLAPCLHAPSLLSRSLFLAGWPQPKPKALLPNPFVSVSFFFLFSYPLSRAALPISGRMGTTRKGASGLTMRRGIRGCLPRSFFFFPLHNKKRDRGVSSEVCESARASEGE